MSDWLRELPAVLPVALAVTRGADGQLLYVNPEFGLLFAVDPKEVLGTSVQSFYDNPDEHGEVVSREIRARRANGEIIWVALTVRPIRFGDESDTLLNVLQDITDRRREKKLLTEQADALAEMARFPEMNPGPVCRMDCSGTILLANRAAQHFFRDETLAGRSWFDVCPGLDAAFWNRVLRENGWIRHEAEVNGVWFVFAHRRDGDFVFAYGADITARKQDERLLAEQAAALALMARFPEMNPGPVLRLGRDANILLANAAARAVFGMEGLVGRCWKDLCPGMNEERWRRILAAPDIVFVDAQIGPCSFVFAHRKDGDLVFVFGADVTQQRTAEQLLRQTEKMATLGTLAAGVAHELNNPAAATKRSADQLREAFAQLQSAQLALGELDLTSEESGALAKIDRLMQERALHPVGLDALARSDLETEVEEWLEARGVAEPWALASPLVNLGMCKAELDVVAKDFDPRDVPVIVGWVSRAFPVYGLVHEIGQAAGRISEIVKALKSYSFLGQAPVQAVDLREGLDNTLIILRSKLKAGITVHREYAADLPPIQAYGSELNQVWTNLLDNAADAMGGRGTITIRAYRKADWAIVEIEDDGPGIPAAARSRIFDPFFTTKAPGKGTGLGLSTSYNIVTKKHGGEIEVDSKPGKTRFWVKLPIGKETNPSRPGTNDQGVLSK